MNRLWLAAIVVVCGCIRTEAPDWVPHEGYRVRALISARGTETGFTEIHRVTEFANAVPDSLFVSNRHLINGSGVAAGDVNGDGWPDVFLVGMVRPSVLLINEGGWRMEDRTQQAGLTRVHAYATGATLADLDGDRDLDLLVSSLSSGIQVFVNDGIGAFTDITRESGLDSDGAATTLALADVDGDGDLDLYAAHYKTATVKDLYPPDSLVFEHVVRQQADSFVVAPSMAAHYDLRVQGNRLMRLERAERDRFYLNTGSGRFAAVDLGGGMFLDEHGHPITAVPADWALTARFQDFNDDGYADLYVCNDFESPDHIWTGLGDGRFQAVSTLAIRKTSQSTMSVAIADINADGHTDLFLADMLSRSYQRRQRQHHVVPPEVTLPGDIRTRVQEMQNMLLVSRGDGTFAETARVAQIAATEWTWSSAFTDVDLDGYPDLLLTTGHRYDAMDADAQMRAQARRSEGLLDFPPLDLPNLTYRNHGDGTFEAVDWGLGDEPDVAHGMALADLDLDGDLDVVVNRLDAPAGFFRNNATADRIAVRLRGIAPNTYGIGARIRVTPNQVQEVIAGGEYLSSSDPARTFAWSAGAQIEVRWPNGMTSTVADVEAGHLYEIDEASASAAPLPTPESNDVLFVQQPLDLAHEREFPYEDFARQPLLPHRLSQRGPSLAAGDIDGDGDDDLVKGVSRGHVMRAAINFSRSFRTDWIYGEAATGDVVGLLVQPNWIYRIRSFSEYDVRFRPHDTYLHVHGYPNALSGTTLQSVRIGSQNPGPMVLADLDADGVLELLVTGYNAHWRFGEPVSSAVLERVAWNRHDVSESLSAPFADVGMVSGATAFDANGDGLSDLALATVWGPIRVFVNQGDGLLAQMTQGLGLARYTGWWNGVAPGDFDGDGRMDLVATGWGLNHPFAERTPMRVWVDDIDHNSTVEIITAHWNDELGGYGFTASLPQLTRAIPALAQRVRSYAEFSNTPVDQVLPVEGLPFTDVATFESAVFLNRGTYFEHRPLPMEAQWTVALSPVVADFDGDGNVDVFLSQNYFALPEGTPRLDSGRGLLLTGDGTGRFEVHRRSGIAVYGEQRAAVALDFDRDGRMDLAVTQNANATVLYRNATGTPGLAVLLDDSTGGVGASVRAEYSDGSFGPAHPVTAGSGYASQNTLRVILGRRDQIVNVHVRWSGGAESTTAAPTGTEVLHIPPP